MMTKQRVLRVGFAVAVAGGCRGDADDGAGGFGPSGGDGDGAMMSSDGNDGGGDGTGAVGSSGGDEATAGTDTPGESGPDEGTDAETGDACAAAECTVQCPQHCPPGEATTCGDRVCDARESAVGCPVDCGLDGGPWLIATPECNCNMPICTGERNYSGMIGIPDLATGTFTADGVAYQGGLYPNGDNLPPDDHLDHGVALGESITPIGGKICMISVGMSNTSQKWAHFIDNVVPTVEDLGGEVVVRNGAIGSRPIDTMADPQFGTSCADGNCQGVWAEIENAIGGNGGCSMDEVQVVWMMHSTRLLDPTGDGTIPTFQQEVVDRLFPYFTTVVDNLAANLPNVKLIYISSRTYGGYGTRANNPEPFAHHNGFAVKWTVEEYIKALRGEPSVLSLDATQTWVGWGPYLWADGLGSDGDPGGVSGRTLPSALELECSDFQTNDGIHPALGSEMKAGAQLRDFFTSDPTATPWFLQ